ncbi:glycine betaine/L-proline ABC transporter substrate-binding protein ProX [Arhodomonas sp. AD133]|uniref:glycine betaine/L-proline ABC transporter substrate-binding protein ProX n=1 Tax=Arhodomonas sp. AD133 TaxID=3415009 RepID=UPI003EBC634E
MLDTARKHISGVVWSVLAVALLAFSGGVTLAQELPGEGKTVRMARATWDTGWFQTEVYTQALEALGYRVDRPITLDNPPFYQSVGQGDVDLWVNGWFPLHNTYREAFEPGATIVGYVAEGGALQGYLIDKKTQQEYGITNLEDFKKPEVKELFDTDGNGKADLVACPPGWGCEKVISHHLDAYELRDHIDPIKAGYAASMADALGRYEQGDPIFFYTWTPNWTVGLLKPGEDVMWLEVPRPDLPPDQKELEDATTLSGVNGCVDDPCEMGWPANDIRPVANKAFLEDNPAVRSLLENMRIPIEDIFAQNALMNEGEDSAADLERHAKEWIEDNQEQFDEWIAQAKEAAM